MKKLVVLTGAAGGIGSHLVRELSTRGYRIVATDYELSMLEGVAASQAWSSSVV